MRRILLSRRNKKTLFVKLLISFVLLVYYTLFSNFILFHLVIINDSRYKVNERNKVNSPLQMIFQKKSIVWMNHETLNSSSDDLQSCCVPPRPLWFMDLDRKTMIENILARDNIPFVFIPCPDLAIEEASILTTAQYPWAFTYILSNDSVDSYWEKLYFYTDILQDWLDAVNNSTSSTHQSSWIGSISWKSLVSITDPIDVVLMNKLLMDRTLLRQSEVDVLILNNNNIPSSRHSSSLHFIKDSSYYWNQKFFNDTKILLGNDIFFDFPTVIIEDLSFVARPHLISEYIFWLRQVIHFFQLQYQQRMMDEEPILLPTTCKTFQYQLYIWIRDYLTSFFFQTHARRILRLDEYLQADPLLLYRTHHSWALEQNQRVQAILKSETQSIPMLFILCHSPESQQQAQQIFNPYTWGNHIYYIPSTLLFETYFYSNILENLIKSISDHEVPRWIGSISWKANEKINITTMNEMLTDSRLLNNPDIDALAFYDAILLEGTTLWAQSELRHPGLMKLMLHVLTGVNESKVNIAMLRQGYPNFKSFFSTYFVTRDIRMREYIVWLRRVLTFMHRDPVVRRSLWSNSHYSGDAGVAKRVFGVGKNVFYPFHPFLGERLVQYYFNSRRLTIVCSQEYITMNGRGR